MAILDEMQLLVSDLEAAFSYRLEGEKERLETAASDARYRAMGFRELRATAAENARERLAEISRRSSEIADMMDTFFQVRTAQAASDARDRAGAERERRAAAAKEARERMAESHGLSAMWRGHTAVIGGRGTETPRTPVRRAAQPPAPRAAMKPKAPMKPRAAMKPKAPMKPKAAKATASNNSKT
jgi:uncharacterized membrane protein YccC